MVGYSTLCLHGEYYNNRENVYVCILHMQLKHAIHSSNF